jgi:hypothetical protein
VSRKSLIKRSEVQETAKAHNCQASKNHRLQRGDRRLAIWKDRSAENYCATCAKEIIRRDIERLTLLAKQIDGSAPLPRRAADEDEGVPAAE